MRTSRFLQVVVTGLLWLYFAGVFATTYWLVVVAAGLIRGRRGISWTLGHYLGAFLRVTCVFVRGLRIEVPEREQLR
jgi:hypothetical protein